MSKGLFYKSLLIFCFAIMITGCKQYCYKQEVKEINFVNEDRKTVELNPINYYPMGGYSFVTFDDYIFFITNNPDGQLRIFDINNDSEVASIGSKGRAKNEFITPSFIGEQVYMKEGEITLPILDNGLIKEINIPKSIQQGTAVVSSHTLSGGSIDGSTISLLDNEAKKQFSYKRASSFGGNCIPPAFFINEEGKEIQSLDIYGDPIYGNDAISVMNQYNGSLFKHPQKNIIIQPLAEMNYILFFDIDNNKFFSVHQDGTRTFEDKLPDDHINRERSNLCFGDVAVSDNFFFVLYYSKCRAEKESDSKCEVLMFDWDGNYLNGFKSDTEIHRISYNKKNNMLYGICIPQEQLFSINIDSMLK